MLDSRGQSEKKKTMTMNLSAPKGQSNIVYSSKTLSVYTNSVRGLITMNINSAPRDDQTLMLALYFVRN